MRNLYCILCYLKLLGGSMLMSMLGTSLSHARRTLDRLNESWSLGKDGIES